MNLFSETEGLSGENLSSALLRFILMRSQDARTKFAELLTDLSGESFAASYRFACNLEAGTKDDIHGAGRIDMLIELDDALVGVENKFNAGFQVNQPGKYLESLRKFAEVSARSGAISKNRYLLLILAPVGRKLEIEDKIRMLDKDQQKLCKFLSWEELLKELLEVGPTQDSKTREVIADFSTYVNKYTNQSMFNKDERWFRSLDQWRPYGSKRQIKVVSEVREFFPEPSGYSPGKKWRGYYFGNKGWFGFVEKSIIVNKSNANLNDSEAVFVIVISFEPSSTPNPEVFRRINMVDKRFCLAPEKAAYALDINEMRSREKWIAALIPFVACKPENEQMVPLTNFVKAEVELRVQP